jgi:hypothetical protein
MILAGLLGCDASGPATPAPPAGATTTSEVQITPEERAALQALGYADFSATATEGDRHGVVVHAGPRVQPGYRLYVTPVACEATLIDDGGGVVRSWRAEPCEKWSHAQLLPGGDLLVPGRDPREGRGPALQYLLRLSFTGEVVWKQRVRAHHDAALRPDGSLLALTSRPRVAPEIFRGGPVLDNPILAVSADGETGAERSLLDTLAGRDAACALLPAVANEHGAADLFHTNAIEWVERDDLRAPHPAGDRPRLLLTLRHQNCVVMLDAESMEVVWEWGRGILDGPHDATLLADGNLLVFDNGMERGWSRVLEIDPRTRELRWEYPGTDDTGFFTPGRGSSQRLANGNTLIAESNAGRAFEITPEGDVVWEFLNPTIRGDRRASIIRMIHYEAEFIDPLLAADPRRRDSRSGG